MRIVLASTFYTLQLVEYLSYFYIKKPMQHIYISADSIKNTQKTQQQKNQKTLVLEKKPILRKY
jgi:hypothetical protein